MKQEGRGRAQSLKNNIATGQDKDWLKPTRSKMAQDLTSIRP